MSQFEIVASYDSRIRRKYGRGLFAGLNTFNLTDAANQRASVAKCTIGNLIVGEVRSTGHRVDVLEPFGVSVLVPLKGRLVSEASDTTYEAVANSSALLFSPNRRRTQVIAPENDEFHAVPVIVPFTEIAEAAESMGLPSGRVRQAASFNIEFDARQRSASGELANLCLALHSEIARGSRRLTLPGAQARWSEIIREKIVEVLDEADVFQLPKTEWHSTNGRHVSQAMECMRAHLSEILLVTEVAQACGVSSRTLEHAFKAAMGMTPMQVLVSFRLEQARAMLLDATEDASVTQVALACGFRHLGRFAKAYGERFGELPSETAVRS